MPLKRVRIIFLNEPTSALDPRARHEIRNSIRTLAAHSTTIVFTSHDMEEVGKLADRIVLIVVGCIRGFTVGLTNRAEAGIF